MSRRERHSGEPPLWSLPYPEHEVHRLIEELEARDRSERAPTTDKAFERRVELARQFREARLLHKAWQGAQLARRTDEEWDDIIYKEPVRRAANELAQVTRPLVESIRSLEGELEAPRRAAAGRAAGASKTNEKKRKGLAASELRLKRTIVRLQEDEDGRRRSDREVERLLRERGLHVSRRKVAELRRK